MTATFDDLLTKVTVLMSKSVVLREEADRDARDEFLVAGGCPVCFGWNILPDGNPCDKCSGGGAVPCPGVDGPNGTPPVLNDKQAGASDVYGDAFVLGKLLREYEGVLRENSGDDGGPVSSSPPARIVGGGSVTKGAKVEVVRGKQRGTTGIVFWTGPAKFGKNRVGLKTFSTGETVWVNVDEVEAL